MEGLLSANPSSSPVSYFFFPELPFSLKNLFLGQSSPTTPAASLQQGQPPQPKPPHVSPALPLLAMTTAPALPAAHSSSNSNSSNSSSSGSVSDGSTGSSAGADSAFAPFLGSLQAAAAAAEQLLPRSQVLHTRLLRMMLTETPPAEPPFRLLAGIYTEAQDLFLSLPRLQDEQRALHRTRALLALEGAFGPRPQLTLPMDENDFPFTLGRFGGLGGLDCKTRRRWMSEVQRAAEWVTDQLQALAQTLVQLEATVARIGQRLDELEGRVVVYGKRDSGAWEWLDPHQGMPSGGRILSTL